MRYLLAFIFCVLLIPAMSGCDRPEISEKGMGTIIYEVPEVKGADKPYELPELAATAESDKNAEGEDE